MTRVRELISMQYQITGDSVVVVPGLISRGRISRETFMKDLAGLPVMYSGDPLLPHPALSQWLEIRVREAQTWLPGNLSPKHTGGRRAPPLCLCPDVVLHDAIGQQVHLLGPRSSRACCSGRACRTGSTASQRDPRCRFIGSTNQPNVPTNTPMQHHAGSPCRG